MSYQNDFSGGTAWGNGRLLFGQQSAHQIGTAYDADNAAIADDRHTFYAVCRQEPRNLSEAGLLAHRDHCADMTARALWF